MEENSLAEKVYNVSEIDAMIKTQTKDFKYSLLDVILLLLYADKDPIRGKIRQMKQIFLALKEVLPKDSTQPVIFKRKQFGPYSEEIEYAIDQLAFSNYVSILGRKTSNDFSVKIERKGIEYIKNEFDNLPNDIQITLKEKRHEWDTFTSTGIINYVYIHNKEFLENSVLKKRHTLDWSNPNQLPEKVTKKSKLGEDDDN
ncbi:MAG: hypothetical protein KGI28_02330 [Thaumarchaeota archaeon]|nr:hypothetical protein [Nitrososphaerota archaeon]